MNNIIPLQPGSVPAHVAARQDKLRINQNAHANMRASFPRIGIKGRMWWLKYGGEATVWKGSAGTDHNGRPLPEAPVQNLDVIIINMASALQKTYYEAGYSDGNTNPPDCFSVNGVTPDPASPHIQAQACAGCPMNAWGSGGTTPSGKKSRACKDGRRIAVVPAGDVENERDGGTMLLLIPPASLTNLDRYTRRLNGFGAEANEVVTRLSFNTSVSHPEIVFEELGWVSDPEIYERVQVIGRSEQVREMLEEAVPEGVEPAVQGQASPLAGGRPVTIQHAPVQASVVSAEQQAAMQRAWGAKEAADLKARQEAAAQPTTVVQAPQKPAPRVAPAQTTVTQAPAGMEDAISSTIADIDDILGAA